MRASKRKRCVSPDTDLSPRDIARKARNQATERRQETQRAFEHVDKDLISSSSSSRPRPVGICYNCGQDGPLAITHDEDAVSNASRRSIEQAGPSDLSYLPATNLESRLDRLRLENDREPDFNNRLSLSVNLSVDCRQMPVQLPVNAPPPPYYAGGPLVWPEPMDVDPPEVYNLVEPIGMFENFDNGRASQVGDRKARRVDRKGHSKKRAKLSRGSDECTIENPSPSRSRYDPLARMKGSGTGIVQRLRSSDPFIASYARYEHAWKAFDENAWGIRFSEVPWPVATPPKSAKDVSVEEVQSFFRLAKVPPDFKFLSVSPLELKEVARSELEYRWSEAGVMDFALKLRDCDGGAALAAAATVQAALRSLVDG